MSNKSTELFDTLNLGSAKGAEASAPSADPTDQKSEKSARGKTTWLSVFPKEIQQWASQGVHFDYSSRDDALRIEGFYKHGPIRLDIRGQNFVAVDKRGEETIIRNFDDLVRLNYESWRLSTKGRNPPEPDKMFIEAFLARKLVRRSWVFQPNEEGDE